jgi:lantibiotic modifying enzyme
MKTRNIRYRRKKKSIVIDGIKTLYNKKVKEFILTLPSNPIDLIEHLQKGSFFTQEKYDKIIKKIEGLDYVERKESEGDKKVRTIKLMRTSEKDPFDEEDDEEFNVSPDDLINDFKSE